MKRVLIVTDTETGGKRAFKSIRIACEHLGLSKSTLYHHFIKKNKPYYRNGLLIERLDVEDKGPEIPTP